MSQRSPSSSLFRLKPRRFLRRQAETDAARPGGNVAHTPPPPAWTDIAPALRAENPDDGASRHRLWFLVLQAKSVPYRFVERDGAASLFILAPSAETALREILAFERERPPAPLPAPREQRGSYWFVALLAALIPWHRARWGGLFTSPFPGGPESWAEHAGLDAYRVANLHEWWRSVTSLTLHADGAHLISNVVMGGVFGVPLCRYTGVGFGVLLTVLGGACGNIATAYLRPASAMSQGFSTALFASVGLLAVFAAMRAGRHAYAAATEKRGLAAFKRGVITGMTPIFAGLGFLAMLGGSEAPNVDYLAHVMGFFSGVGVGLVASVFFPRLFTLTGKRNTAFQFFCLAAAFGLILFCWEIAFTRA